MRLFRSVIDPGYRWLVKHLNRLQRTLEGLYDRLREAIAIAVARAAEDAVREGVHALLMDRPPLCPPDYPPSHFTPHSGWGDTDDEDEELRRWEENLDHEQEPRERDEPSAQVPSSEETAAPTRLRRALAEGLQAAGWWLRRGGRFPLLTALGAGLAVL